MNYVILKQYRGCPYLSFTGGTCYTRYYKTYFYCVKPEDETKIHEVKALEMLSAEHDHVLESVPQDEYWTLSKLVQLLESKEESCFIMYVDIDYERAWGMYSASLLDNKDTHIYSIIRVDP